MGASGVSYARFWSLNLRVCRLLETTLLEVGHSSSVFPWRERECPINRQNKQEVSRNMEILLGNTIQSKMLRLAEPAPLSR